MGFSSAAHIVPMLSEPKFDLRPTHIQVIVNKIYSYFCTNTARGEKLNELCH